MRNHSMPLEALRYDVTPLGLHYLLIHFDIPQLSADGYELGVGGHVRKPLRLTLDEIKARPAKTLAVTIECAGNGRARLTPRPMSQPWLGEAVGNAEWTGTSLGSILEEAGPKKGAVDVVFTGHDHGVQGGVEQDYERSLSLADASRDEVMLAYAINGQPLPPQHGFPLRLLVPGWYGMAHVKWLRSITVTETPFRGYQQATAYHFSSSSDEQGEPVTRMLPRALMVPPGVQQWLPRVRFVEPGIHILEGRAWSGRGEIVRVEFSADGGASWTEAMLEGSAAPHAWLHWSVKWQAPAYGEHTLCVSATDAAGNTQPVEQAWSTEGVQNNAVQRVRVVVGPAGAKQVPADSV